MTLRVGSLFSGIGGMDLGLEWAGMEVAWQCEIDPFCLKVLEKHWPNVKRYNDVRTILDEQPEAVDVIAGGPPCQPASLAGKRKGKDDDHWLWPETLRAVATLRPAWCLFENPPGFITMGLDETIFYLERGGYACWPVIIPACAVEADQGRERVWLIANRKGEHLEESKVVDPKEKLPKPRGIGDATRLRMVGWEADQPSMVGVAHGFSGWVDRSKALGNAVVPQVVHEIGRAIMAAHVAAIQGKPGDIATRTIQK